VTGDDDTPPVPQRRRRRLKDRVPVRLRHHWKPAGGLCVGLAVMVYAFGDVRISPYVTSASAVEADVITEDVRGTVGLYDTSVTHSIQLEYRQTDFEKMMKEFEDDGTKDSIKADLTIDGVYLQDVGIRLKGNSTLQSLRGTNGAPGAPGAGRAPAGGGAEQQQGAPRQRQGAGAAPGGAAPGAAGGMGGGMTQYNLSADKPEELPWLIKIDEYIEGRAYQGEREISLRPGSNDQVPLNEALSLSLMDDSGEAAERYGFSTVKVNNRPTATRLMVENPDTDYAEDAVEGNGVLYKARAGGTFAYKGDDPSAYEASFRQLNKVGSQDLEPVMKLVKWVEQASDAEFARDLEKYVDVESFAKYVAAQNLLMNFDDMAGPGKNYLLWYDLDTKRFSVLGWDYNLTFSGNAAAGPDDQQTMGGGGGRPTGGNTGGRPGGVQPPDGAQAPEGMTPPQGMEIPKGMQPPEGMELPEGMERPGADGAGGGGPQAGHVLKERFLGLDAFDAVYKKAYQELYGTFYGSGSALTKLADIEKQARAAKIDSGKVDTAIATLRETVTDRSAALAADKAVVG